MSLPRNKNTNPDGWDDKGIDREVERMNKQAAIDAEKHLPGPASPELCKQLGIDPNDLKEALPPTSSFKDALDIPRPAQRSPRDQHDELLKHATAAVTDEAVRTKEAVLNAMASYLSSKPESWWSNTKQYSSRLSEAEFVSMILVSTYRRLEDK